MFFLSFQTIYAQNITSKRVFEVTDSIVLSIIQNKELFQYFSVTENSYYEYKTNINSNKIKKSPLLNKKTLKRNTTEIWVQYYFNYPKIEGVRGWHWITLNNKLEFITSNINFSFVPFFLIKNQPSYFISKKEALEKGIKYIEEIGTEIKTPRLYYYTSHYYNQYTESLNIRDYGYYYYLDNVQEKRIERIYIDAVTGNFFRKETILLPEPLIQIEK